MLLIIWYAFTIYGLWVMLSEFPKRTIFAGIASFILILGDVHGDVCYNLWFVLSLILCFWRELGIGMIIPAVCNAIIDGNKR